MAKAIQTEQSATGTITLDAKDLSILALLQQNARMTVKEIADKIHLSTTPVHERIKRLEASNVIKQYATLVDHTKVNKALMVICSAVSSSFVKAKTDGPEPEIPKLTAPIFIAISRIL